MGHAANHEHVCLGMVDLFVFWGFMLGHDPDVSFPQLRALKVVYVSAGHDPIEAQEWLAVESTSWSQAPAPLLRAMLSEDSVTLQTRPAARLSGLVTARIETAGLREVLMSAPGACARWARAG